MIKRLTRICQLFLTLSIALYGILVWNNNRGVVAPPHGAITASWDKSVSWLLANRRSVLENDNPILWWMIAESARLTDDGRLHDLFRDFRARNNPTITNSLWQALFEPERYWGATFTRQSYIGYMDYQQYLIFGLTCSNQLAAEPLILAQNSTDFCPRTHPLTPACATHQLMGFRFLQRNGCTFAGNLQVNISSSHATIERQLTWDPRLVDVYIQRVVMLADSGASPRIKPRWLERILAAQLPDGSWPSLQPLLPLGGNNYLVFGQNLFGIGEWQGNLHTTAQGLWLMSLLRYQESHRTEPPH